MPFQLAKHEPKQCAECGELAAVYCKNEELLFCTKCDYTWHNFDDQRINKEENYKEHIRIDVHEMDSIVGDLNRNYG